MSPCSQGISQLLQKEYTIDSLNKDDFYHVDIIRTKLTRNIAVTFEEVREELILALNDLIPTDEDGKWQTRWGKISLIENAEWVKFPIIETIQRVVCRATNRVFVGIPLCLRSLWIV